MKMNLTTRNHGVTQPPANTMRGGLLQRKCDCGQHMIAGGECNSCSKETKRPLQRSVISHDSAHGSDNDVPSIVHDVLRSSGRPLDTETRSFMESRFGHDFSQVRVHTDSRAANAASAVKASAFTMNRNIVFGDGQYAPHSESGRRLISHELTHVVQQRAGIHLQSGISAADDPSERQADEVAGALADRREGAKLLKPYQPTPGSFEGAGLQRQIDETKQDTKQTVPDERVSANASSDPLVLVGAVGIGGMNRADDVAKVQARLHALGLLSEDDFAAESPQVATLTTTPNQLTNTGIADSTAYSTAAITMPSDSLSATMPVDTTGANVLAPDPNVANTTSAIAVTTENTEPTLLPESSLTATIIAIQEFQRALFSKETVDGNIGPSGPTWRALSNADEASFATLKNNWEAKKQEMSEEQARQKAEKARLKAESERKLKDDAERKKSEELRISKEAEKKSTATANKLLAAYATYLPLIASYINLDESGLARVLAIYATFDAGVVLKVFDALDEADAEQVAAEMIGSALVGELSMFAESVLLKLMLVMMSAENTAENTEMSGRILAAMHLKHELAKFKESSASKDQTVLEELKEQIKAKRIAFDSDEFRTMLLGENIERGQVAAGVQKLVLYLSKLESLRISSIFRKKARKKKGLHDLGRAVDIGNETIAKTLLPQVATDAKVAELGIDELIFDATMVGETDGNKWNYNDGNKYEYGRATLKGEGGTDKGHTDHIHFGVKAK